MVYILCSLNRQFPTVVGSRVSRWVLPDFLTDNTLLPAVSNKRTTNILQQDIFKTKLLQSLGGPSGPISSCQKKICFIYFLESSSLAEMLTNNDWPFRFIQERNYLEVSKNDLFSSASSSWIISDDLQGQWSKRYCLSGNLEKILTTVPCGLLLLHNSCPVIDLSENCKPRKSEK